MDMTATERLRALLDERGVEWEDMSIRPYACTSWRDPDGEPCTALEGADDIPDGKLSAQALLTPEQAIAATLGTAPLLPHFWTHDGALHVELPKLPESISVRLPDQRDREVGSAMVWQYTRDSGTCRDVADTPQYGDKTRFECSECGYEYSAVGGFGCDYGDEPDFRFCPNCGKRVVDE